METLQFSLVSPEKVILDKQVSMVVVPGIEGDVGVLPGHAPFLTLLRPGVVTVYEEEKVLAKIFVNGGFSEINPEKCVALVTEAVSLEALDKSALEIEIKNLLEDRMETKTKEEKAHVEESLDIARAKLMEILSQSK